jgi:hypothetical protein
MYPIEKQVAIMKTLLTFVKFLAQQDEIRAAKITAASKAFTRKTDAALKVEITELKDAFRKKSTSKFDA